MRETDRISERFLGLELAGAKNQKTALAAIEYYPKEQKVFLLDVYEKVVAHDEQTGDQALLELLREMLPGTAALGVNVPLELPPCVTCTRKSCPLPDSCTVPAVKWMRETAKKAARRAPAERGLRAREFTPYTQRPIELWVRYGLMPALRPEARFEIDETLGGNKAPLTARMHFLKRHLHDVPLVEVLPKLSTALLMSELGLSKWVMHRYRHLEEGAQARAEIIEKLAHSHGVFIYERDVRKLSHNLAAFDAFICAYTALLSRTGRCAKNPKGFPAASGWISYPAEA